jgi:hypothetical protein
MIEHVSEVFDRINLTHSNCPRPTFKMLCICEPDLLEIEKSCREFRQREPDWIVRNRFWYKELKPWFMQLVGFCRDKQDSDHCILTTSEAYDVAYFHFIDVLEI